MDDPAVPRDDLARSLRYLRLVNRWAGGASALIGLLSRWSRRWPRDRPISLLDIATGSADIPVAARRWALSRGFDLRVTGVDVHETTLAEAGAFLARVAEREPPVAEGIALVRADARRLLDLYAPGSFDYVHAALFLHHLPDLEAATVLAIMGRLARAGIVWSDLVRSRLMRAAVSLSTIGQPVIIRHDARVSVEAGFTRAEVEDLARRLDLRYARYRRPFGVWYRFTFAGEKPGAWT